MLVTVSTSTATDQQPLPIGAPTYDAGHPLTEDTPLAGPETTRVRYALACGAKTTRGLQHAGRAKVVEIRAADYIGPRADSVVGSRFVPRVLAGRSVTTIGRSDVAHTFTYTEDVARLAVTVGADPRAWGKAWHVPSNEPRTQQEVANDVSAYAGVGRVRVRALSRRLLYTLGLVSRQMHELRETEYQFRDDFVMDSSLAQATFALAPTPWSEIIAATVKSYTDAVDQRAQEVVS